jgi:hypothetical protein
MARRTRPTTREALEPHEVRALARLVTVLGSQDRAAERLFITSRTLRSALRGRRLNPDTRARMRASNYWPESPVPHIPTGIPALVNRR